MYTTIFQASKSGEAHLIQKKCDDTC